MRSYSSIKGSEYQTIHQVLGFEADDDRLLAMIIQNETQDQNKSRVEAFQSGTYSDFLSSPQTLATESLKKQLQSLLLNKLKAAEREELAKHEKLQRNNLAIKLLKAPDQFYAYVLMQEHKMSFGKGDFQKIIDVLKMGYDAEYRDVGNKLLLFRNGKILRNEERMVTQLAPLTQGNTVSASRLAKSAKKSGQPEAAAKKANPRPEIRTKVQVNPDGYKVDWTKAFKAAVEGEAEDEDAEDASKDVEMQAAEPREECAPMFTDKSRPHIKNNHSVNYKHVFQIWAQHIHLHPDNKELSLEQLLGIFPEFTDRIRIYDSCCNEKGQIVRNHQAYKQYKASAHTSGKRGGQKVAKWATVTKKQRRGGRPSRASAPFGQLN